MMIMEENESILYVTYLNNPQKPNVSSERNRGEDRVHALWRHKEGNISEIPCRVSSDAHEWCNDWGTVSRICSVKIQYR